MSNKSNTPAVKRPSVQAYLDDVTHILTIVPPNGTGQAVFATTAPEDIQTADESTRLLWARNRITEEGYATMTRFRSFPYPYGVGFNVRQVKRSAR